MATKTAKSTGTSKVTFGSKKTGKSSKKFTSNKRSKNYKKPYRGQGRKKILKNEKKFYEGFLF